MKKQLVSIALCLAIVITVLSGTAAYAAGGAGASMSNFQSVAVYENGTFADVGAGAWYAPYVRKAYELGIMDGKGGGTFDPEGNIRVSEAIKMACVVHNIYNGGAAVFARNAQPWYRPYVDYARENGLLGNADSGEYDAYIERGGQGLLYQPRPARKASGGDHNVETCR
jgi:hypothetical protein